MQLMSLPLIRTLHWESIGRPHVLGRGICTSCSSPQIVKKKNLGDPLFESRDTILRSTIIANSWTPIV